MPKDQILIVADEQGARTGLRSILALEGYEVAEAKDGEEALAYLRAFNPQVVLSEVELPRMDGLTLLKQAKAEGIRAVFLMMTSSSSVETAVEAMKAGAENYLVRPLSVESVLVFVQKALEKGRLVSDARDLRERVRERFRLEVMVGGAPELQAIFEVARRAATSKATVLVLGEAGTGKELIAQALHEQSPRHDKPFVKLSCAGVGPALLESGLFGSQQGASAPGNREGCLARADGGTLFLDEVAELALTTQAKILRLLERHEFEPVGGTQTLPANIRLIAASSRDLAAEVKTGRFREDLYSRLSAVSVTLPPLRQRKGDIPALAAHFLETAGRSCGKEVRGLAPGTLHALVTHDWPGNVRELKNAIEFAVLRSKGKELRIDDLPSPLREPRAPDGSRFIPGASLHEIEHEAIVRTLEMAGGSTLRTAEILGISVRKIQYRLKEYGSAAQPATPAARPLVRSTSGGHES